MGEESRRARVERLSPRACELSGRERGRERGGERERERERERVMCTGLFVHVSVYVCVKTVLV